MSIQSMIGNFQRSFNDKISSLLASSKTQMQNIVGDLTTSLSNVWSGGFTGMSAEGIAELKIRLTNYCQELEELIQSFDHQGDISVALKGDVQTAAYDFIAAVKELLKAYVSTIKQAIAEADEAYSNFMAASQGIAASVRDDAAEIRSNASSIRLD